jgi:phosphoglycerol transferase MdoB-like AlkP superfamily enzyme
VSVLLLLLTAVLFLPIRGGFGTGTNHTGSVYFSDNIRLNHAAVNPIFSFVEAVLHQEEIGTKYRFMSDEEATALFEPLTYTPLRSDSAAIQRPNVILVVLESFSDSVMQANGVTPYLQQYTNEGLYFTNFYANSFRTDRALASIHSGLPAQPSMSVMDIPRISTSLPSIAGVLASHGYQTTFYYGGDINYSNMRSYFMGTGFQHVVSDVDFPSRLHTGKWGVADGPVYDRMLADIKADSSGKPFFLSIMTSSSHEPFDVPNYHKIRDDETLNAFSYADHCLGRFVEELKALPCWQNTLVAIVADHLGAYPDPQDNYQLWRYHIPFVIMGGPIMAERCQVIGSQIDIPATLLGLMGYDHSSFLYSKDLLDVQAPHFAFFSFPDAMGMVTDSSAVVYDNTSGRSQLSEGKDADSLLRKSQAYLQKLYDDLDKR